MFRFSLYSLFVIFIGCNHTVPVSEIDTIRPAAPTGIKIGSYGTFSVDCPFGTDPEDLEPLTSGLDYSPPSNPTFSINTFLYPGRNDLPVPYQVDIQLKAANIDSPFVVIAEGMSNSKIFFDELAVRFNTDTVFTDDFTFVNLSEPGCDLECWTEGSHGSKTRPDKYEPSEDVRIALLHHSNNRKQQNGDESKPFPQHAIKTCNQLVERMHQINDDYPNLEIILLTSRVYGGLTCGTTNREPVALEEGFSVKYAIHRWNVEENDNNDLPFALWGPYFWDKTWDSSYFLPDLVHPSQKGADEFSDIYTSFLTNTIGLSSLFKE